MAFTEYDRHLYHFLFDSFQQDEFHVEFDRESFAGDYNELVSSIKRLEDGGILMIIGEDENSICVELDFNYCYDFQEI